MKKISKLLAAVTLGLVATFTAVANPFKICNDNVEMKIVSLVPSTDGKCLLVDYQFTVNPAAVEECGTLLLTPVIKKDPNKHLIEVIAVNAPGRTGLEKWLENKIYGVCDPNYVRVFTLKEGENLVIKTQRHIPYEEWMDGARLMVTSQMATYSPNCINGCPGEEDICEVPFYEEPLQINPEFVEVKPDIETGDVHKLQTRLYYPVNVTRSVESYMENKEALKIMTTIDEGNFEVLEVAVEGWASPESPVIYNQGLADKRAATVKDIIAKKYGFGDEIFQTVGRGEYWANAEEFINSTDVKVVADNREALLDALKIEDLDAREAAIRKVAGGKTYKAIFDNTYARSRFADCVISYKMRSYAVEDILALYNVDPMNIGPAEYAILVANGAGDEILNQGLGLYPDSEALNAFAAERALADFNVAKAIEHYKKAGTTEEVMNNLGACYLLVGDADAAEACFAKAGNLPALDKNYEELDKVRINNKYFPK